MPPYGYGNKKHQKNYYYWIDLYENKKEKLSIKNQIKNFSKKLKKAVKKENYLKAAKYRDLLIELKK